MRRCRTRPAVSRCTERGCARYACARYASPDATLDRVIMPEPDNRSGGCHERDAGAGMARRDHVRKTSPVLWLSMSCRVPCRLLQCAGIWCNCIFIHITVQAIATGWIRVSALLNCHDHDDRRAHRVSAALHPRGFAAIMRGFAAIMSHQIAHRSSTIPAGTTPWFHRSVKRRCPRLRHSSSISPTPSISSSRKPRESSGVTGWHGRRWVWIARRCWIIRCSACKRM